MLWAALVPGDSHVDELSTGCYSQVWKWLTKQHQSMPGIHLPETWVCSATPFWGRNVLLLWGARFCILWLVVGQAADVAPCTLWCAKPLQDSSERDKVCKGGKRRRGEWKRGFCYQEQEESELYGMINGANCASDVALLMKCYKRQSKSSFLMELLVTAFRYGKLGEI